MDTPGLVQALIPFACIVGFIFAMYFIGFMLSKAPHGEEIEGVGFVRNDEQETK